MLTNFDFFPSPVSEAGCIFTTSTASTMESFFVTSRAMTVTLDSLARSWSALEGFRRLRKTWNCSLPGWRAKALARQLPLPPALQPVMRTVFLVSAVISFFLFDGER